MEEEGTSKQRRGFARCRWRKVSDDELLERSVPRSDRDGLVDIPTATRNRWLLQST